MTVITSILGTCKDFSYNKSSEDIVLLTSEERISAHLIAKSQNGKKLKLSLPRGVELHDGDVIAIENNTPTVIRSANEDLFRLEPDSLMMWAVAGFHLGNLHRPVRFSSTAIFTPKDIKVADILLSANIKFSEISAPFEGLRFGSYSDHTHGFSND